MLERLKRFRWASCAFVTARSQTQRKMADRALELQLKVRHNSEEIGDFLKDLDRWEDSIKSRDDDLKTSKVISTSNVPPVRNKKKKKSRKKKDESKANTDKKSKPKSRISSYDYRSWDQLDVDKVINEIEEKDEMETLTSSDDDDNDDDDDDEQAEEERRLQKALLEKDKGNDLFKVGRYEEAINCYTTAIQLDPNNAVLPANRAMALLKVNRYGAAAADCDLAIAIDDTYTKAYLRRGKARQHMDKLQDALSDYQRVLKFEPGNKQAQQEVTTIRQKLGLEQHSMKSHDNNEAQEREKKPLKRITIEEIGSDSEDEEEEKPTSEQIIIHADQAGTNNLEASQVKNGKDPRTSRGEATALLPTEENRTLPTASAQQSTDMNTNEAIKQTDTSDTKNKGTAKTSITIPKNTRKVFAVPKTSVQFQGDWKVLRDQPEELFEYLKKIPAGSYPKLFQQSIDSDMLTRILAVLHDHYVAAGLPVFKELHCLSEVKRFSMAVMFLSDKEKAVLQDLMTYTRNNSSTSGPSEQELNKLANKYSL